MLIQNTKKRVTNKTTAAAEAAAFRVAMVGRYQCMLMRSDNVGKSVKI